MRRRAHRRARVEGGRGAGGRAPTVGRPDSPDGALGLAGGGVAGGVLLTHGLDPRDVAAVVATLGTVDRAFVVGVRSIGTTMSAVAAAAIRARGGAAERCTVRPTGNPFDRRTVLSDATVARARHHAASGCDVIVIDEGPGLSGSSLLSAVDALAGAGVPRERVRVLCTRLPEPTSLTAPEGARRWAELR